MHVTGILLHVYNLGCRDWERLVWGDPARDLLGAGAKLFECLMAEPADGEVHVVLYDGPSSKDEVSEGEYTRDFLLRKLRGLHEFPKLKARYDGLTPHEQQVFRQRVESLRLGEAINNTYDEICRAAEYFNAIGATRILHVAAASHAPRCIARQAHVREIGLIPPEQLWYTVASDLPFASTSANDVVVVEPPHRADDPLLHFQPMLATLMKEYYKSLNGEEQKQVVLQIARTLEAIRAERAKTRLASKVS